MSIQANGIILGREDLNIGVCQILVNVNQPIISNLTHAKVKDLTIIHYAWRSYFLALMINRTQCSF